MAVVIDFFVINFFVSRYGMADLFFNLHWDIDSESTAEPLPSGTGSELGPGAVIAAVNLGCAASVLFEPRYGDMYKFGSVSFFSLFFGPGFPPVSYLARTVVHHLFWAMMSTTSC